jgi:hypothetical protein
LELLGSRVLSDFKLELLDSRVLSELKELDLVRPEELTDTWVALGPTDSARLLS